MKYCHFAFCKDADFPKDENISGGGVCRTFDAVWCRKLKKHVEKNKPCEIEFEKKFKQKNKKSG